MSRTNTHANKQHWVRRSARGSAHYDEDQALKDALKLSLSSPTSTSTCGGSTCGSTTDLPPGKNRYHHYSTSNQQQQPISYTPKQQQRPCTPPFVGWEGNLAAMSSLSSFHFRRRSCDENSYLVTKIEISAVQKKKCHVNKLDEGISSSSVRSPMKEEAAAVQKWMEEEEECKKKRTKKCKKRQRVELPHNTNNEEMMAAASCSTYTSYSQEANDDTTIGISTTNLNLNLNLSDGVKAKQKQTTEVFNKAATTEQQKDARNLNSNRSNKKSKIKLHLRHNNKHLPPPAFVEVPSIRERFQPRASSDAAMILRKANKSCSPSVPFRMDEDDLRLARKKKKKKKKKLKLMSIMMKQQQQQQQREDFDRQKLNPKKKEQKNYDRVVAPAASSNGAMVLLELQSKKHEPIKDHSISTMTMVMTGHQKQELAVGQNQNRRILHGGTKRRLAVESDDDFDFDLEYEEEEGEEDDDDGYICSVAANLKNRSKPPPHKSKSKKSKSSFITATTSSTGTAATNLYGHHPPNQKQNNRNSSPISAVFSADCNNPKQIDSGMISICNKQTKKDTSTATTSLTSIISTSTSSNACNSSIPVAASASASELSCLNNNTSHWVRRSVRQPHKSDLNNPNVVELLSKLRENHPEMKVLKLKKFIGPDAPQLVMDSILDALEENVNCQALYIQVGS